MKAKIQKIDQINDINSFDTISSERAAEMKQHIIDLEASSRELQYISYSISHDLRASLRCIDGFSLALQEDYTDILDSTAKEYIQTIRTSTQQMGLLIDDIIELSRLSRMEIHLDKVDLSKLANQAIEELKHNQPVSDIIFVIADRVEAFTDENLLKLVFHKLIGNAIKYTGKQNQPQIEFGVTDSNGDKAYFIRDNSVYFDPKNDHKSINPSQNNHNPDEFTDSGVGLAAVQLIINRLGGRVWAEKNSGQGTTFYFTFLRGQSFG